MLQRSKKSLKITRVYEDKVIKLKTLKTRKMVRDSFIRYFIKPHSDQGYSSGYDLVFGSFRGLHWTWLVPRKRASSDGMDDSDSGEWIHLKRGIDCGGCGPICLRGHHIMICGGVPPPSGESGGARN
ncbi:hypothetical protein M9H77_11677 [Catharanthus roseus]|uniref:Uncharacterized protein n=1 Tax=Catharanthus roseus TaxID=4058 RepID=A0ACC0BFB8_CATRO|nr:hypothetical protein M9H77_11677 [Catharanthus roseus]